MKMIRSLITLCAVLFLGGAQAQLAGGLMFPGPGTPASSSSCTPGTHASTFLARTSGLSGTETTAYCNLINGLDTDSTFALFDALWVFATNTTTTANLNLVSTSFTLTVTVAPTFTADQGYTGNGTTQFLQTNFTPSTNGVAYTQNSASFGVCVLNSRAVNQNYIEMGVNGSSTAYSYIEPLFGSSTIGYNINAVATFPTTANTNAQGSWIMSRTASSTGELYFNGANFAAYTGVSTALVAQQFFILGGNNNGSVCTASADKLGYAFLAGGLNATQAANIRSRLNTFLVAVGNASVC